VTTSPRHAARLVRRLAGWLVPGVISALLPVVGTTLTAHATVSSLTVSAQGAPISSIATSALALTPTFAPDITDYVLRCVAGTNNVQVTLASSPGKMWINGVFSSNFVLNEALLENQALVIKWHGPSSPTPIQYWIRCLPHDFPQLAVSRPGNPFPGWYLTGNISASSVSNSYAMILDNHGTPVWYRRSSGLNALNTTLLSGGRLAWMTQAAGGVATDPLGTYEVLNIHTLATTFIRAPIGPTDFHELEPMANGDLMYLSAILTPNIDMSGLGGSHSATLVDCLLEEVDPFGHRVWTWRASDHISVNESTHQLVPATIRRQTVYDMFHCNSVDTDPVTGDVLLSMRHTDAVYRINKGTGMVTWKLGGKPFNSDGAQILAIVSDPDPGAFHTQHDARFEPGGDVSLYDDQSSKPALAARGIEYHIDTVAGTATLDWSYSAPDGKNSAATGSFRRLDSGNDNVIGWGIKANQLFTEVDASGTLLMQVTFPNGEAAYRVNKLDITAIDHSRLRNAAGLPRFVVNPVPRVTFVQPGTGPMTGGTVVSIYGSGFTGASGVFFGSTAASSFTVVNDSLIHATAPVGTGTLAITVTAPGGTSSPYVTNLLRDTASDANFEAGTGTWLGANLNSSISLAGAPVRTGHHSLKIQALGIGDVLATTGLYGAQPGSQVTGYVYVTSPSGATRVNATIVFFDSTGTSIGSATGTGVVAQVSRWDRATVTALCPPGTASIAIGADVPSAPGPVYFDDASIGGTPQFDYGP
jgi:hypothetical protein